MPRPEVIIRSDQGVEAPIPTTFKTVQWNSLATLPRDGESVVCMLKGNKTEPFIYRNGSFFLATSGTPNCHNAAFNTFDQSKIVFWGKSITEKTSHKSNVKCIYPSK